MVENGTEQNKQPEQKKRSGIKIPAIVVVSLIIFALIPTSVTVPYQRLEKYQESYTEEVANTIQVPYSDIEYYTEKEPFTDTTNTQQDLLYKVDYTTCAQSVPLISDAKVTITVNNLDSTGGTFKFWVGFELPDGNKIGQEVSNYIYAKQSADFTYTANAGVSQCNYHKVSIPTKTITETFTNYRDVRKSRTVTKYRTETQYNDVVKTRPAQRYVTDYKQESVFMFQRILGWY